MNIRLTFFLSTLVLFLSTFAFSSEDDEMDYEQYISSLPIYEEPLSLPIERIPHTPLFTWIPAGHVKGLNILGLVPSVNIGVGRVNFEKTKQNSALFEYNWGYRVFSWFNLAFSYQNQHMEVSDLSDTIWTLGKKQFKDHSKFALHSLMFKAYLESPRVLKAERFFITPYVAMAIGPGWVQRGIFGASVSTWEADIGLRFGAIHPISFISFMTGGKFVQWGNLGHSLVQYLGLRLNF